MRALALLRAGVLPRSLPVQRLGGRGSGTPCSLCDRTIGPTEMELELEFMVGDAEGLARVFHLHMSCSTAWEIARKALANETPGAIGHE